MSCVQRNPAACFLLEGFQSEIVRVRVATHCISLLFKAPGGEGSPTPARRGTPPPPGGAPPKIRPFEGISPKKCHFAPKPIPRTLSRGGGSSPGPTHPPPPGGLLTEKEACIIYVTTQDSSVNAQLLFDLHRCLTLDFGNFQMHFCPSQPAAQKWNLRRAIKNTPGHTQLEGNMEKHFTDRNNHGPGRD